MTEEEKDFEMASNVWHLVCQNTEGWLAWKMPNVFEIPENEREAAIAEAMEKFIQERLKPDKAKR